MPRNRQPSYKLNLKVEKLSSLKKEMFLKKGKFETRIFAICTENASKNQIFFIIANLVQNIWIFLKTFRQILKNSAIFMIWKYKKF